MKARCIVVAFFAFVASGSAKDLVIERIVIKKHPIPAPYYVYFGVSANAGRSKASYHIPNRKYESFGLEGDIEIPVNLILKDVREREWATVTLHIDNRDEEVTTTKALKKHTGRIQILNRLDHVTGKPSYNFVVANDADERFVYQVFWQVK